MLLISLTQLNCFAETEIIRTVVNDRDAFIINKNDSAELVYKDTIPVYDTETGELIDKPDNSKSTTGSASFIVNMVDDIH